MAGKINKYLVCIAGPTAVGKTSLAIALAQEFETEIVSADSRQLYRQMTIGTAKPTKSELALVKHHFVDILDVAQPYSAGDFERDALKVISAIHKSSDIAIMCGGTGFYHRAVLQGFDDFPTVPKDARMKWEARFEKSGIETLKKELQTSDPEYYRIVDLNNHSRLIRALSVIESTGRPFSSFLKKSLPVRPFKPIRIFLNLDREILYDRINNRVDQMIKDGLVDEVKSLIPWRDKQALQTVGYKELFEYFDGKWSLEQAIDKIKQHSRNYAKRQITWHRNQSGWMEMDPRDTESIIDLILGVVRES